MWNRSRHRSSRPRMGTNRRGRRQRSEDPLRAAELDLARGRFNRAVRQALDVAAESPRNLSCLNRIGDLLVRADRVNVGVVLFERVGRAYADDGFWAKAIAMYKKILRHDPWRSDIRVQLAFLYQRSGLPTGAGI